MIHSSTIEEIKNRIDIVDVVSDFVMLKRAGSSYRALSPFTNEKTPSFYVVPSKGIFKDFSSGKGGDAITFVMEVDGLSYVEALKYLAGKYGIALKEEEPSDEALIAQNKRESLYIVLNFANRYFQKILHASDEGQSIGLTYFKERGFSDEVIKKFELGYSRESWNGLLNEAIKNGYKQELLEEAGLVVSKGEKWYDRFRNRGIFPIHNVSGKPIAFGGRILTKTGKQPKYINSPETELYIKSKTLYGLYQSKNAIRKEDNCILVEGYTDVISLHQAGIENVVSSSGTSLTQDQVKIIRRYTENITVLFDGDVAGIRASLRGIDLLLAGDFNVKAVALPQGEDPDSYSKQLSYREFQDFIAEEAQDIIRFKTKVMLEESGNDPIKKASVIKEIVSSITQIADPVKRTVYIKECSHLLDIAESVLVAEQNKILLEKHKATRTFSVPKPDLPAPPQEELLDNLDIGKIIELQERESVRVLIRYGSHKIHGHELQDQYLIDYFLNESEEIQFANNTYRKIMELFKAQLRNGKIIDQQTLLNHQDEDIRKTTVDLVMEKYEVSDNWYKKYKIHVPRETEFLKNVTYTNILRLKFRIIQRLIWEESQKLKEATDEARIDRLLEEIEELKKVEVEIAKILGNVIVG